MEPVDYQDTFITVAEDCPTKQGTVPRGRPGKPSVASLSFQMISEHPYRYTSGDVIFAVFADREGIPEEERELARAEFYSRGRACLRSSELAKRYGWGIHADGKGRIALVGLDTPDYSVLASGLDGRSGRPLTVVKAMRNSRATR